MRVGQCWLRVLLAGVLVVPVAVVSVPAVAQAAKPTVVSAVELRDELQVGQRTRDTVRVSGPIGRPVQVQFRTPGAPWRTAVTLVTDSRRRVNVAVAVTSTGGRLVWQARQRNGLWAVAAGTAEPGVRWRVRVPAVAGWTRAVSPAQRVQVVRFPRWIRRVSVSSSGAQASSWSAGAVLSADGRYVAFESRSPNLVRGDTNGVDDVFVHDRVTGRTSRVSVSSTGAEANGESYSLAISADGRYVAFESFASNLVRGDRNGFFDVFVHDRDTGRTSRVNVSSTGTEANRPSPGRVALSANGRYVAFSSSASNLVRGDTNGVGDVFVRDRSTGRTSRVSVSSTGNQANSWSGEAVISANGRYVTFTSGASNLVRGDTNGVGDVFVHDRATGQTSRVSVSSTGTQANDDSYGPALSGDGRYVAFASDGSNLVRGDTNGVGDVFVHDRSTGQTSRVSVSSTGTQANSWSFTRGLSADGRYVALDSYASNLVPGDTDRAIDLFVHDRLTGKTRLVAIKDGPGHAAISADGRFVALDAHFPYLVRRDTNRTSDVFVARIR
jgi:hypothetical protein